MTQEEAIHFWKKSADLDKKTAEDLFQSKNYASSLFFIHLFVEKLLKGLVQKKTKKTPPFTHDLLVLAKFLELTLTKNQEQSLVEINTFNIRARYADYKFSFYKKATRNFAAKYRKIAEEFYAWFSNLY